MKKIILLIIILAGGLLTFGYFMAEESPGVMGDAVSAKVIFFYGRECPHCKIVEEFMEKNGVAEKLGLVSAEIYHNKENQELFRDKFSACGVKDEKEMGVPMVFSEGKCYVGQTEAIEYFKLKIN